MVRVLKGIAVPQEIERARIQMMVSLNQGKFGSFLGKMQEIGQDAIQVFLMR